MKRRSFMRTTAAAVGTAAASALGAEAAEQKATEMYELRIYTLALAKLQNIERYLSQALIPALHKLGIGPIGAFLERVESDKVKIYLLIVHPSAESVATLPARLAADADYGQAAREYLDAKAQDPAYSRVESSLLTPIAGMPTLARPNASKPRVLNLRIYESHNERAAAKKVEMFNTGELAIFRRVGLTPVFFASAVVGSAMPNLTYMLVFPDDAGRAAAWTRFRDDAEWLKLRAIPEYADKEIVSRITNKVLTPLACSEI
jgi:NIPSNAP